MRRNRHSRTDFGHLVSFADTMTGFGLVSFLLVMLFMLTQGRSDAPPSIDVKSQLAAILEQMKSMRKIIKVFERDLDDAKAELANSNNQRRTEAEEFADSMSNAMANQDRLGKQAAEAEAEARDAVDRADAIRKNRATRVMFCTDGSASMADGLNSRRGNAMMFARVMPSAMTQFEMGFLTYRDTELNAFPLRVIKSARHDGGHSLAAVEAYLNNLEPKDGMTCVGRAIDAAIGQLEKDSDEFGAEVLCVIADVGPGDLHGYDRAAGNTVIRQVQRWATFPNRNRRVIAIQTGGGQTGVDLTQHRPFFAALGEVNTESAFSENLATLFPLVFEASFVAGEE